MDKLESALETVEYLEERIKQRDAQAGNLEIAIGGYEMLYHKTLHDMQTLREEHRSACEYLNQEIDKRGRQINGYQRKVNELLKQVEQLENNARKRLVVLLPNVQAQR